MTKIKSWNQFVLIKILSFLRSQVSVSVKTIKGYSGSPSLLHHSSHQLFSVCSGWIFLQRSVQFTCESCWWFLLSLSVCSAQHLWPSKLYFCAEFRRIYQSPQKQRRITQQICCDMTSLLLCPAGKLKNTLWCWNWTEIWCTYPCTWSSSSSLWKKLFSGRRQHENGEIQAALLPSSQIPAAVGPLAGVLGTCRAFRECGWEDGHNFQRGNRTAQLQQTEAVWAQLSSIPDLIKPLHSPYTFPPLAKDKFLYLLYLFDVCVKDEKEETFSFYGSFIPACFWLHLNSSVSESRLALRCFQDPDFTLISGYNIII